MSSQIYTEATRTLEVQIATPSGDPHHPCEVNAATTQPVHRGPRRRRLGATAAVLALALASTGGAIATASTLGSTTPRFVQQIRLLETRGYVQKSCTLTGTAMFNPRTGRTVTVKS